MSYSLFNNENNFTQVLFGKTEAEVIKERNNLSNSSSSPAPSIDSGCSTNSNIFAENFFLLKVLDSLLEVHDPRVIRLPTHLPPPPFVSATHRSHQTPSMAHSARPQYFQQGQVIPPRFYHSQPQQVIPESLLPTPQMMLIPPPSVHYFP